MRQIASELGVTTGVLYHYFPNKEVLFDKLADYLTTQDILGVWAEMPSGSRADKLRALMHFVEMNETTFVQQLLLLTEVYRVQGGDKGILEAVREATQRYVAAIDQALGLDDAALARFVFVVISGLVLQRHLNDADTSFGEQQEVLLKLLAKRA